MNDRIQFDGLDDHVYFDPDFEVEPLWRKVVIEFFFVFMRMYMFAAMVFVIWGCFTMIGWALGAKP